MAANPLEAALQKALASGDAAAADYIQLRIKAEKDPLAAHYTALRRARDFGENDAASVIEEMIQARVRDDRQADLMGTRKAERFAAGVGAGMSNAYKNVGDIAGRVPGLGALRPDPQAWAEERESTQTWTDSGAGAFGKLAGEVVSLPAGVIGAGMKAAAGKLAGKGLPLAVKAMSSPVARSMAEGAAQGYVLAGPENRGSGAALTALLSGGLTKAGQLGSRLASGLVKPSASARYLMEKGADDLTIGQMTPGSRMAQVEQAGQSVVGAGPMLTAQREAGQRAWQDVVMRQAGETVPGPGGLNERLAGVYGDLDDAYASVRAAQPSARATARPPNTTRLRRALELAAEDKGILATEAEVGATKKFLGNQASMAERQGAASPEVLLRMRSNIRKQARGLEAGDARLQMLERAEESINNRLRYILPSSALEKLKATDAQYGQYKVLEKAMAKSKDSPSGFTPNQLSTSLMESMDRGAFARGAGGELRNLARAGRETLDTTSPPTGARAVTMQIPILKHALAGGVMVANTSPIKRALLGDYAAQKAVHQADEILRSLGIADALRRGLALDGAD